MLMCSSEPSCKRSRQSLRVSCTSNTDPEMRAESAQDDNLVETDKDWEEHDETDVEDGADDEGRRSEVEIV